MNCQITLSDNQNKETICIEDIQDRNVLSYQDTDKASNLLRIYEDGIVIKRLADTHITLVSLFENDNSFIEINSQEGSLKFHAKVLAFRNINDIITIAYEVEGEKRNIEIRYLGATNDK